MSFVANNTTVPPNATAKATLPDGEHILNAGIHEFIIPFPLQASNPVTSDFYNFEQIYKNH
jgi:hypothetical protein